MGVRVVFLPDCPLVLSLLKHRGIGAFLNIKMRNPNKRSPLNNSIDKQNFIKINDKFVNALHSLSMISLKNYLLDKTNVLISCLCLS